MISEGAELSGELKPEPSEASRFIDLLSLESVVSNEDFESGCRGGTIKPEGSAAWSISIADLDSASDSGNSSGSDNSDVSSSSTLGVSFGIVSGALTRLSGGEAAERALEVGTLE